MQQLLVCEYYLSLKLQDGLPRVLRQAQLRMSGLLRARVQAREEEARERRPRVSDPLAEARVQHLHSEQGGGGGEGHPHQGHQSHRVHTGWSPLSSPWI